MPLIFDQICHMNSLCNQRYGCLPPVSKCCFCCSEIQNTFLTSCHWVAKIQWWLAWDGRKLRFSKWIQQHLEQHWLLRLEWCLWEMIYKVKVLRLLGDKKQDCFHVETCGNTSETSSAAAEIDKQLQVQSKAPDVYFRIRECLHDWKCNAIRFYPTWHMNALCHQRSGCLPPVSKSCFCCSEILNTFHKSCHW